MERKKVVLLTLLPRPVFSFFSGMDDVFFSYITGVLEELGSPESSEETFDMDTFVEMMEAYIPGFAEIQRCVNATVLYVYVMHWGPGPTTSVSSVLLLYPDRDVLVPNLYHYD